MGPIALFDKSFLQSLSEDEALWFDWMFLPNVCPVFYVETLADLRKERENRTGEREVQIIANKTPEMSGWPNAFHRHLVEADLFGNPVAMTGQIIVPQGRVVEQGHSTALIQDRPPEFMAFERWQAQDFDAVDREFAARWRAHLESLDHAPVISALQNARLALGDCTTLEGARELASRFVSEGSDAAARLELLMIMLGVRPQYRPTIRKRWRSHGGTTLAAFAPYAAFVLEVNIFFYAATESRLITQDFASSRMDISYLFYLPFCMMFVSSDRLHRRCAPLFLRNDQEFVWGLDLKPSLQAIDVHYSPLSKTEENDLRKLVGFGPPDLPDNEVVRLWDRFCRTDWRDVPAPNSEPQLDERIAKHLESLRDAPSHTQSAGQSQNVVEPDTLILQRRVRSRRGKWQQAPPE